MKKSDIYKIGKDLGIDNNKIEKILLKVTGIGKSQLFLCDEVDNKYLENISDCVNRVIKGEPIEYIINNAEFYGFDFYVDNRVLIPRNDTEVMVDKAIEEIKKIGKSITLIDVGTGSSCITISILKQLKENIKTYVIDISKEALEVSKKNIEKYGLRDKVEQINGDLLEYFLIHPHSEGLSGHKFGKRIFIEKNIIITANLPYIKNGDFKNMDKETINYEPSIALYGGENTGFELYEKLILQCIELKKINKIKSMTLFIEIGFDQKEICEKYLNRLGKSFEIFKDNSQIERCVKIKI